MHAYTNDFKIQVLFVPKEKCYILNTPTTTGHNSQRLQTFVTISHTMRLSNCLPHTSVTGHWILRLSMTKKTERRATNSSR